MPGRERERSMICGKKRPGRWCIKSWLTSPLTEWWTNTDGHKSSTETDFLSCQRLAFPCVWAAVIHGTGVPAPPHARLPLQEVEKRGCHKRKVVRQSPNDISKASLGWKNGKLQLILWTSTRASTKDGWRPQVKWFGCKLWKEHIHKAEGMTSIPIDAGR